MRMNQGRLQKTQRTRTCARSIGGCFEAKASVRSCRKLRKRACFDHMHNRQLILVLVALVFLIIVYMGVRVAGSQSLPTSCLGERIRNLRAVKPIVVVTTVTSPSFQISLHSESYDPLRWKIATMGEYYDRKLTNIARRFLYGNSPGTVVDVGANIGWLSLYAMSMGHTVFRYEIQGGPG